MTKTRIQPTEYLNSASRKVAAMDTPWWKVRASLALAFVGSVALVVTAYRLAGMVSPDWVLTTGSFAPLLTLLSATPTLLAIGFAACLQTLRSRGRPILRNMYGLLALAAFLGAGLNISRDVYQQQPLESWIENMVLGAPQNLTARVH